MSFRVWPPSSACPELQARSHWDWLITSTHRIDEERARWCANCLGDIPCVEIQRGDRPHRFVVASSGRRDKLDWSQLADWLGQEIHHGQRVLVDMDLLAFDILLYLFPALRELGLADLGCVYVAPDDYDFPEKALSDLLLHPIEQPKAYVALALDADRTRSRHLVFLNFDLARAWKFIDRYDWKYDHLQVVVGSPAFVREGRERAIAAAQPWIEGFLRDYPDHLQELPAFDPDAVADWCRMQWQQAGWLDIVPIGPKPMNLGILFFYFALPETERGRVRLLYDFPVQQSSRSRGVREIYFYDCARLLK